MALDVKLKPHGLACWHLFFVCTTKNEVFLTHDHFQSVAFKQEKITFLTVKHFL